MSVGSKYRSHLVIPDVQASPAHSTEHLRWIGNYIADKRPDTVVCIGDFSDVSSLSSYAVGKADAEGKRYSDDVANAKEAMIKLLAPVRKCRQYAPKLHLTLGNHEHRIAREAESNPRFVGTLSIDDLGYKDAGWTVHDFLKVVVLDGVEYSHYFISGCMGRPVSSAAALLRARHRSAIMGHVQRVDVAIHPNTQQTALMTGICYTHDETYMTPQGQDCKRGIWVLHEVNEGRFDLMAVSLGFLKRRYS